MGSTINRAWPLDFATPGLGDGEQVLPRQGQEIMFNLMGITGIMETLGGIFHKPVALVQLPEQQVAASEVIRSR
jgi:hypothetical protein